MAILGEPRDHMNAEQLEHLSYLESTNIATLIDMGMEYELSAKENSPLSQRWLAKRLRRSLSKPTGNTTNHKNATKMPTEHPLLVESVSHKLSDVLSRRVSIAMRTTAGALHEGVRWRLPKLNRPEAKIFSPAGTSPKSSNMTAKSGINTADTSKVCHLLVVGSGCLNHVVKITGRWCWR